jgi:plasmid stability protein
MTIELPEKLATALKVQANAHGVSPEGYVCEVLERELAAEAGASNRAPALTGADLVAAMRASPHKEIDLEPRRDRQPVRDVGF